MPTNSTTIALAKITQYLWSTQILKERAFQNGSINNGRDIVIYMENGSLVYGQSQNITEVNAVGTITVDTLGNTGDIINVTVNDPDLGVITIGTYTIVSGDTTLTILAGHLAAAITGSGYTATSNGAVISVTARSGLGSLINGLSLIVSYIPFFIPQDLPGFWAGYESDNGITLSGSDVISWDEITGQVSKQLYKGVVAGSPTLINNVLNGLPVLNTDGVTGQLESGIVLPKITDCTVYVVGMQKAGDTTNGIFISSGDNLEISRSLSFAEISGKTTSASQNITISATNDTFYSIRLAGDSSSQNIALNNGVPTTSLRTQATITPTYLDVFYNGSGFISSKQIAAIWIFLATHTTNEINLMEQYLNDKYALY